MLTRPLGASLGDLLSQSKTDGGLGLGTVGTSAIFLIAIVALVVFLSVGERRKLRASAGAREARIGQAGAVGALEAE